MADELDFDDFEPEEAFKDSGRMVQGSYHVMISAIQENGGRDHDKLSVAYQVCAGTDPKQKQQVWTDNNTPMSNETWAKKKRFRLAVVIGLITMDEAKALRAAGKSFKPRWQDAVGRHLCIVVEKGDEGSKYETKPLFAEHLLSMEEGIRRGIPVDEASLRVTGATEAFGSPRGGGMVAGSTGGKSGSGGLGKNGAPVNTGANSSFPQRTAAPPAKAAAPDLDAMFG